MAFLQDILVSNDMFGYYVNLNLGKSDSHNTVFGGFVSIFVKVTLTMFLYLRLMVLLSEGGDENSTQFYLLG